MYSCTWAHTLHICMWPPLFLFIYFTVSHSQPVYRLHQSQHLNTHTHTFILSHEKQSVLCLLLAGCKLVFGSTSDRTCGAFDSIDCILTRSQMVFEALLIFTFGVLSSHSFLRTIVCFFMSKRRTTMKCLQITNCEWDTSPLNVCTRLDCDQFLSQW